MSRSGSARAGGTARAVATVPRLLDRDLPAHRRAMNHAVVSKGPCHRELHGRERDPRRRPGDRAGGRRPEAEAGVARALDPVRDVVVVVRPDDGVADVGGEGLPWRRRRGEVELGLEDRPRVRRAPVRRGPAPAESAAPVSAAGAESVGALESVRGALESVPEPLSPTGGPAASLPPPPPPASIPGRVGFAGLLESQAANQAPPWRSATVEARPTSRRRARTPRSLEAGAVPAARHATYTFPSTRQPSVKRLFSSSDAFDREIRAAKGPVRAIQTKRQSNQTTVTPSPPSPARAGAEVRHVAAAPSAPFGSHVAERARAVAVDQERHTTTFVQRPIEEGRGQRERVVRARSPAGGRRSCRSFGSRRLEASARTAGEGRGGLGARASSVREALALDPRARSSSIDTVSLSGPAATRACPPFTSR